MELKDFKAALAFKMHLNLGKTHISTYEGAISAPGHLLDGRILIKQMSYTKPAKKNNWKGATEFTFWLSEPDAPSFSTFKELKEHYENDLDIKNPKTR